MPDIESDECHCELRPDVLPDVLLTETCIGTTGCIPYKDSETAQRVRADAILTHNYFRIACGILGTEEDVLQQALRFALGLLFQLCLEKFQLCLEKFQLCLEKLQLRLEQR